MADLGDGEMVEVKGSAAKPYELRNTGGVYSCTCPAWRNQGVPIEQRSCKHLRKLRGDAAEAERIAAAGGVAASAPTARPRVASAEGEDEEPGAVAVLLAERWDGALDPTGWWMSEKLDGVRAYWDGAALFSRLGNPFHAPDWFLAALPPTPLDGELWVGRRQFQRTVSIVRRQDRGEGWREVSFLVFDAPAAAGGFEARLAHCRDLIDGAHKHLSVHHHERCEGIEALTAELARVEALGGEGVMLREPGSPYVAGRSTSLLKVKSFRDDEAVVVGHLAGRGRHEGRLGALEVERPDGIRFSVGTGFSDAQRASPPPIGAVITYRYQELTDGGVPRFPSFVGERDDVRIVRVAAAKEPAVAPAPAKAAPAPAKTAPAVASAVGPSASGTGRRRFEFNEGGSNKFWEVVVVGAEMTVWFGRVGTNGQSKTKSFATPEAATREAEKLVAEKTGKGYVAVD